MGALPCAQLQPQGPGCAGCGLAPNQAQAQWGQSAPRPVLPSDFGSLSMLTQPSTGGCSCTVSGGMPMGMGTGMAMGSGCAHTPMGAMHVQPQHMGAGLAPPQASHLPPAMSMSSGMAAQHAKPAKLGATKTEGSDWDAAW